MEGKTGKGVFGSPPTVQMCFQNQLPCSDQAVYLLGDQTVDTGKLGVASLHTPSHILGNEGTVFGRRFLMEERISFKKDIFYFPICFFSQYSMGSNQVLQHSAG